MLHYIVVALLVAMPLQVYAVNKCFIDGKTAYQDKPCPNEGVMLENIHPETDAEKSRREQDAAVVTHNLGESSPFSSNQREYASKQKQRRAARYYDTATPASSYRHARRNARVGGMRSKRPVVKNRFRVMRGF